MIERNDFLPVQFESPTERTLNTASQLRDGLLLWQEHRRVPEANTKNQFWAMQESVVEELLNQRVAALNPGIETFQKKLTLRFLKGLIANSPLPPTGLSGFVDQILISQKTEGEIPVTLQQIACLNYRHIPELNEEHVLPITDKTKRWKRFIDEEGDFLTGLNEIGARPVVVFGVSDVLDFEGEDTFADSPELLHSNVLQNRQVMQSDMDNLSRNLKSSNLAQPNCVPTIVSFAHSEMLEGQQRHSKAFQEFSEELHGRSTEVDIFRKWLITNFIRSHEYLERLDPAEHLEQIIKMMALYAADNALAVQTAQEAFHGQSIEHVTSVCLQPRNEPDWLTEKVACDMLQIPIVQIVPFPNAGKWWYNREGQGVYSFRKGETTRIQPTPEATFKSFMRKPDEIILPDLNGSMPDEIEKRIALKAERVTELVAMLWGRDAAIIQKVAFERMRDERKG